MKHFTEGFRNVIHGHQAAKPDIRQGDEWKHSKSLYYLHNSRYTFGFDATKGTALKDLDEPGWVDETPCPRCPDCGWGIDFGEGEEPQMKCSHCGSSEPARWSE